MFEVSNQKTVNISKELANEEFVIFANVQVEFNIEDIDETFNLNFFVEEGAKVSIKMLSLKHKKTLNLKANVCKNGLFLINIADFVSENIEVNSNVILYGDNSKSEVNLSSLVNKNYCKKYNISFSHIGENTNSNLKGYGVSQDKGNLIIKGISHIEKGSIKSKANQIAKIILFDKASKASASPILKIDCDDIKANHGCAIGALNQEHLYYLLSRGLSLFEAKRIITEGYLLPIAKYFNSDEEQLIKETIEGSIKND